MTEIKCFKLVYLNVALTLKTLIQLLKDADDTSSHCSSRHSNRGGRWVSRRSEIAKWNRTHIGMCNCANDHIIRSVVPPNQVRRRSSKYRVAHGPKCPLLTDDDIWYDPP